MLELRWGRTSFVVATGYVLLVDKGCVVVQDCPGKLLSGDGLKAATEALDRIRLTVSSQSIEAKGARLRVSVTFGVAEYVAGERPEDLIARADAAMYKGKAAGRDVVVAAEPPLTGL